MSDNRKELAVDEEELGSFSQRTPLVLTDGDTLIFKLIYEYRFLRLEHISLLTSRSEKRLHRRIFKLVEKSYLTVIRLPQQKHIYALGRKALPVLVEEGIAEPEILSERLRIHECKELFLKHEMMLVDIHVVLALAASESPLSLVSWREGRELYDSVSVFDHHIRNTLPVRPDALFTLEDSRRPAGANRAHFFLEADRSTSTQTRFREKFLAYWHYLEQGLHVKKFNIKNFRMITITLTDARAQNLCQLAQTALPERARKYFLFTTRTRFSLESPTAILADIYLSARSNHRVPLVASPAGLQ